jgi:hypothetical protein
MPRTPHLPPKGKGRRPGATRGDVGQSMQPYSDEEAAFLAAVEAWKRRTGRKFPAHSEYLAILLSLGYRRPEGG